MKRNLALKKNSTFRVNIHQLSVLYFFITQSLPPLKNSSFFYWSSIIVILIALFHILVISKAKINNYIIWIMIFTFIVLASVLWALNMEYALSSAITLLTVSITFIYISLLINNEETFMKF